MRFDIPFLGHANILCTHKGTLEITREAHLTPRGDCIAGVGAKSACANIPDSIKNMISDPRSVITITITVDGESFVVSGRGDKRLTLAHKHDIVIRKSGFVCPRTLAVRCDKASDDMPSSMIRNLQNPDTAGLFSINVT